MNYSVNSNIFEVTANDTLELYGDFVEGDGRKLVLVVSSGPKGLGTRAKKAFASSMGKLGYGDDACAFATLTLPNDGRLGPRDVYTLTEGLDPLLVIAADAHASDVLAQAYRTHVVPGEVARLLGRPCIAFASFEDMLESAAEKQQAWALMKRAAR